MTDKSPQLTRNQSLVLGALSKSGTPMSAYDILDRLRVSGLRAPPQVYRALEKLVDRGLVHRLESMNAFVACSHEQCHVGGLVAFAICNDCGTVNEFADQDITRRIGAWTRTNAFAADKTTIEIRGLCAACAGA